MRKIITFSQKQTRELGKKFAAEILKKKPGRKAVLLCLEGELGSGKTTFIQGLAKGLGIKDKIFSPTFVLFRRFPLSLPRKKKTYRNFYHFDCYRIKRPSEIGNLGFGEICREPENIVAVEWADKIIKILPPKKTVFKLFSLDKNRRCILIK